MCIDILFYWLILFNIHSYCLLISWFYPLLGGSLWFIHRRTGHHSIPVKGMSIRVWPGKDSLSPKESWLMTQWLHICIYVCMMKLYYMLYIYIYTYTCATHRYITGDSRENPDLKPSFPVQAAIGGLEIPMAMGQQLSGNGRCLSTDFPPENWPQKKTVALVVCCNTY